MIIPDDIYIIIINYNCLQNFRECNKLKSINKYTNSIFFNKYTINIYFIKSRIFSKLKYYFKKRKHSNSWLKRRVNNDDTIILLF